MKSFHVSGLESILFICEVICGSISLFKITAIACLNHPSIHPCYYFLLTKPTFFKYYLSTCALKLSFVNHCFYHLGFSSPKSCINNSPMLLIISHDYLVSFNLLCHLVAVVVVSGNLLNVLEPAPKYIDPSKLVARM